MSTKKETKLNLINQDNRQISATLSLSSVNSTQLPTVVLCHGFKGNQNNQHLLTISNELVEAGFATLRFDFTNSLGLSEGRFDDLTISQEIEDLNAVFNFVISHQNVDPKRVGIIGHSLGAFISAVFTSLQEKVRSLILLSPVFDVRKAMIKQLGKNGFNNWKNKGAAQLQWGDLKNSLKLNYSFWHDAQKFDARNLAGKIRCPLMIMHGTADKTVPLRDAEQWFNLSPSKRKEFKLIKGGDHIYQDWNHLTLVATNVINWCLKTIRN